MHSTTLGRTGTRGRDLSGKVTGKQAGKSLLIRSSSGLGETAAMIVGAPSSNSAFSENDMLRMRVADNIGNAGDEQVMRMMTLQHIIVSVAPAPKSMSSSKSRLQALLVEEQGRLKSRENTTADPNTAPQP
jgi:hypothetical protein